MTDARNSKWLGMSDSQASGDQARRAMRIETWNMEGKGSPARVEFLDALKCDVLLSIDHVADL